MHWVPSTVLKTFKEFVYSFTKLIACDHEQMNPSNVFKCIKIDSGGSYFQFISIRNCTEMIVKLPTFFGKTRIQHESFKEEECIDNQMQELSEIISRSNIHGQLSSDPQKKNVQLVRRSNWKRFRMCHFSCLVLDTNEIHEHCYGVVSYCFVLSYLKVQIGTDRRTD